MGHLLFFCAPVTDFLYFLDDVIEVNKFRSTQSNVGMRFIDGVRENDKLRSTLSNHRTLFIDGVIEVNRLRSTQSNVGMRFIDGVIEDDKPVDCLFLNNLSSE
ncbi:MAG: hypothetical protein ACK5IJ_08245 [Mangrovibacterium sp.]